MLANELSHLFYPKIMSSPLLEVYLMILHKVRFMLGANIETSIFDNVSQY